MATGKKLKKIKEKVTQSKLSSTSSNDASLHNKVNSLCSVFDVNDSYDINAIVSGRMGMQDY